jgi:hypothetical protein
MKRLAIIAVALAAFCAYAANEITVNWTFSAAKGNLALNRNQSKQFSITSGTPNVSGYTISVTTNAAGTAISAGAVASNGWGWVLNTATNTPTNITSGVNSIDIGTQVSGTFYPIIRLYPGEGHPIRFAPNVTNYARSNNGTNVPLVLECPFTDN